VALHERLDLVEQRPRRQRVAGGEHAVVGEQAAEHDVVGEELRALREARHQRLQHLDVQVAAQAGPLLGQRGGDADLVEEASTERRRSAYSRRAPCSKPRARNCPSRKPL
jgi:hypothetical protein